MTILSKKLVTTADTDKLRSLVKAFRSAFTSNDARPKYLFGINVYTESVLNHFKVDGLVDDYTQDRSFKGVRVLKSDSIEMDALVLVCSGGRPLSAKKKLNERGIQNLDYFAFLRYLPELKLRQIVFNEDFEVEYFANKEMYQWVYSLLVDNHSKEVFRKLVTFRLHHDLADLIDLKISNSTQYFEDFLNLQERGESFIDVGGFDGRDSKEFTQRCPGYSAIHIFEPSPVSNHRCKELLGLHSNLYIHELGLADRKNTFSFELNGSASRISASGDHQISVDRLDNFLTNGCIPTYIKMDIEGAELDAIVGATNTIERFGPRLAISVYHKPGDFWKIPKKILSIRPDYNVYVRHYSESIYETVMYFIT